jgi:hypothetical protein
LSEKYGVVVVLIIPESAGLPADVLYVLVDALGDGVADLVLGSRHDTVDLFQEGSGLLLEFGASEFCDPIYPASECSFYRIPVRNLDDLAEGLFHVIYNGQFGAADQYRKLGEDGSLRTCISGDLWRSQAQGVEDAFHEQHQTLEDGNIEVYAEHVKGEKSYGVARWIPVRPDGVPVFKRYLEAREISLRNAGKNEDAVFPPIKHDGGYISYGRIQTLKSMVEEDLDIKFDLRKCRRTFGKRALKDGQPIHDVFLVMGHASVATTQREYADKDLHDASQDMRDYWDSQEV